jgi:hypothetical protein
MDCKPFWDPPHAEEVDKKSARRTKVIFDLPEEAELKEAVRTAARNSDNHAYWLDWWSESGDEDSLVLLGHIDEQQVLAGALIQRMMQGGLATWNEARVGVDIVVRDNLL